MSRGAQQVRQSSLTKALKAVAAAGVSARVELATDGKISVYVDAPVHSQPSTDAPDPNEWAIDDSD